LRNRVAFSFSDDAGRLVENIVHNQLRRRELQATRNFCLPPGPFVGMIQVLEKVLKGVLI
jgi:hypothetical protein